MSATHSTCQYSKMCDNGCGSVLHQDAVIQIIETPTGDDQVWCEDCWQWNKDELKAAGYTWDESDDDDKSANSSTYGEGCRRICRVCSKECSCWNYNEDHEVVCEDCEESEEE